MYFLQEVVVAVAYEESLQEANALVDSVREEGMAAKMVHLTEDEDGVMEDSSARDTFLRGSFQSDILQGAHPAEAAILYITDSPALSEMLLSQKLPVLAYLHAWNATESFGKVRYACEDLSEIDVPYLDMVYRRYKGLPWDILTTKRLYVRETTVADVDAFAAIYANPEVTRYTEKLFPNLEDERRYVREYIEQVYSFYNYGVWTVCKKESGEVIGRAGFSRREGYEEPELGFVIGVPWQRQGIATEVCEAILTYGRDELGFQRVQMLVRPGNTASLQLAAKLGFSKAELVDCDGVLYQRLVKAL